MEFNSYSYYQCEVALARLIQKMIDRSKEIENFKKTYIKHMKFDSHQIFSSIDNDKHGALKPVDIMIFLRQFVYQPDDPLIRLNEVKAKDKEAEFIIMSYSNQRRTMLFKDFLKLILPQGEPDFMDQVLKQQLSNVKASDQRMSPFIEHEISILFDMELKYNRDIEQIKIDIANKYQWSYKLAVHVFTKGQGGHVSQKQMQRFMDCNGDGRYEFEDFKYIVNRYKKNDSMEEKMLDIRDFGDLMYPFPFFYDPTLAMYDGYKSREDEIEKEQQVERKIMQRQEFDDKFKIIGSFIKDPEYYEQLPRLLDFLEGHQFKDIYKSLKDFDQYIEFAKKKIVFKKKVEEEKKMVLDYNDIIKQNTQAEAPKKKDHSIWEDGTAKYVPVQDLIQDISGMPHLKDYLKQLQYIMPNPPTTLAEVLQKIRSDRNMFYYDRDDLKLWQRMQLFEDIREEQKKQEKRQTEITNELGKIQFEEKYQDQKQQKKLFTAFSTYTLEEGAIDSKGRNEKSSFFDPSTFGKQFDEANKLYYDQFDPIDNNQATQNQEGKSQMNSVIIKNESVQPKTSFFNRNQKQRQEQQQGTPLSSDDEGEDKDQQEQQNQNQFNVNQPPVQDPQRVDTDESFEDAFRSFQENFDLAEKYTQQKQKRGVIRNANKTIQGFKLLQAVKRTKMVKNILDRSKIGDYSNKAVYKKY